MFEVRKDDITDDVLAGLEAIVSESKLWYKGKMLPHFKLKPNPAIMRVVKTVLLDLSGTLHVEDTAIPGAVESLTRLRQMNVTVKFVTNTTKVSSRHLHERLTKLGFVLSLNEVHSSLIATKLLIQKRKLKPLLLLSREAMEDFEGLSCPSDEQPNAVVVGLAPEQFHYDRLNEAFRCLKDGAELIAIHASKYYQASDGLCIGPGFFVKGLEYSAECKATIVGKPTKLFFQTILNNAKPEETIMIGDDVTDDIEGAQDAGIKGLLVKTGKYREGDENKIRPKPYGLFDSIVEAIEEVERICMINTYLK